MTGKTNYAEEYGTYCAPILPLYDGAVADFAASMEVRRYSRATIISYLNGLRGFLRFPEVSAADRLQDITPEMLEHYRAHLVKSGFTWYTRDLYLRSVRLFFEFLEKEGRIFFNPAGKLTAGIMTRPRLYIPSEKDMTRLLAAPDDVTPVGIRDRAVLELAYCCGLRLEELAKLDIHDPDFGNRILRVQGKGAKERALPMGKHAVYRLQRYLSDARDHLLAGRKGEEALWIGRAHKRRLGKPAVAHIFARNSKKAGLGAVYPHAVRRACATHMLQNGAHPEMIRQLLGHADMCTLSQYLEVSVREMMKTHSRSRVGQ